MDYGKLTFDQVKAIVTKLGGMEGIRRFLSGETVVTVNNNIFKNNKAEDGWKLLEDVPFKKEQFVPEVVVLLEPGESKLSRISNEEIKRRSQKLNAHFGQKHAEYLLEHQELIPKKWRNKLLVFPGTVWMSKDNARSIPCIYWDNDEWHLHFDWLALDWNHSNQLVRFLE
jgi:hypothetical protein